MEMDASRVGHIVIYRADAVQRGQVRNSDDADDVNFANYAQDHSLIRSIASHSCQATSTWNNAR